MAVRIITDSGSDCLPGEHPNLDVLPLSIAFGDTTYSADVDLTRERFYELLVEGDEFPTTGQVNPYAFSQAISRAQGAGDDVVILALSSKLSGTHQSAVTAASQADGSTEVHVVDTKSVTVGQHILVDYALRLVEGGRSAAEVAAAVEAAADRVCLVALLDTLEYLRRGGRLTPLAATFAHLVKAFPVMKQTDDGTRLEKMKVARSFAKAVNAIADDLEARGVGDGFFLGVSHADNRVQADEASGMLSERFPGCRHGVFDLGPAFITQGGPGCLAIQAVDLGAYPDLDLD